MPGHVTNHCYIRCEVMWSTTDVWCGCVGGVTAVASGCGSSHTRAGEPLASLLVGVHVGRVKILPNDREWSHSSSNPQARQRPRSEHSRCCCNPNWIKQTFIHCAAPSGSAGQICYRAWSDNLLEQAKKLRRQLGNIMGSILSRQYEL